MADIWTEEDVSYVRGDGPAPNQGLSDGAKKDGWFLARKTALTPMLPAKGPVTVVTQEGDYELPDGWEGFVAVDQAGYPYPIERTEQANTYERVL